MRELVEVGAFTNASVLIEGESGTGKELLAQLVHDLDLRRQKGDFVILDCAAITPELSGSEFFGHERGAFTGAVNARDGAFALANGGTLFLDEVGELPLTLQAQLLRVVQEHQFKRVGSNTWQRTEFRLVCATNRDLLAGVAEGRFRGDLYHRIAGWVCHVPPLRDRPEDILPLTTHFLSQLNHAPRAGRARSRGAGVSAHSRLSGQRSRSAPAGDADVVPARRSRRDHAWRHSRRRIGRWNMRRGSPGRTPTSSGRSGTRWTAAPG